MKQVIRCQKSTCGHDVISETNVFYCSHCGSIHLNPENTKKHTKQPINTSNQFNSNAKTSNRSNYKTHANKSSSNQKKKSKPKLVINNEKQMADILGLTGRVTHRDIKKAWKEKCIKYHPDKVASMGKGIRDVAEEKTKEINNAYNFFEKKYFKETK